MTDQFNSVLVKRPKRNSIPLPFASKLTCEIGQIVPIFCQEYMPGDSFRLDTEVLVKFAPMLAPIMHEVDARIDFFRCDTHLVNDKSVQMILGDEDGDFSYPIHMLTWMELETFVEVIAADIKEHAAESRFYKYFPGVVWPSTEAGIIEIVVNRVFGPGSLWDYFNFPCLTVGLLANLGSQNFDKGVQPYVFFLNALVYNEYFRDQNVQDKLFVPKTYDEITEALNYLKSGNADACEQFLQIMLVQYRCQPKDYFTSALPEPQRGGEVHLPIHGDIAVDASEFNLADPLFHVSGPGDLYLDTDLPISGGGVSRNYIPNVIHRGDDTDLNEGRLIGYMKQSALSQSYQDVDNIRGNVSGLRVNLEEVTMSTINELRQAEQLQKYLELSARSGGRPGERIWANFAVKPSDSRLGRPEFLGAGKVPVVVSEVKQTGASIQDPTTGEITNDPLGTMAGEATAVGSSPRFTAYFNDYGFVIGYLTIIPRPAYFQGIPRKFTRSDPFEYYLPLFAQLGEQPIKNNEIYLQYGPDYDTEFGYTPRYAEYRFNTNEIHGLFRSSLSYWHMARVFANLPGLNADFLTINPEDYNRVFPVVASAPDTHHVYVSLYFNLRTVREVVKYNIPTL